MNIEIFNLEVCFPNLGYEERVNRVNLDIKRLESMLITKVTDEGNPRANLKWKVEMFVSSFVCRALSLASGTCLSWNKGNGLASIILSRAIMETAAVAWRIEKEINKDLQKKDPKSIDLTLTTQTLGRKVYTDGETPLTPTHILDSIRKMDKTFAGFLRSYEVLSEFAHPNFYGTMNSFVGVEDNFQHCHFDIKFSLTEPIFNHIILGMTMLEAIEQALKKLLDIKEALLILEKENPFDKTKQGY